MVSVFLKQLAEFSKKVERTEEEVFHAFVDEMADVIVNGSPITGSPGQPHDLRDGDWTTRYESDTVAVISTSEPSARSVEDGISYKHGRPLTKLKSPVGGFHSLKTAVAGSDKVLIHVVRRLVPDAR